MNCCCRAGKLSTSLGFQHMAWVEAKDWWQCCYRLKALYKSRNAPCFSPYFSDNRFCQRMSRNRTFPHLLLKKFRTVTLTIHVLKGAGLKNV